MSDAAKLAAKRIADMQADDVRKKVETGDQYGSCVTECPYVEDHIAQMSDVEEIAAIIDEELAREKEPDERPRA